MSVMTILCEIVHTFLVTKTMTGGPKIKVMVLIISAQTFVVVVVVVVVYKHRLESTACNSSRTKRWAVILNQIAAIPLITGHAPLSSALCDRRTHKWGG